MNPFDTDGFPARWNCGRAWTAEPWVGWLHIFSDIAIFAAYFAVPAVVMYFVRQRDDLKFPPIFYGFLGLIFFSCGTVHLIEAGIFWWPVYKLSGIIKFATAVVSAAGVVLLTRVLPNALELKSGSAYAEAVGESRKAQAMLKHEQFLLQTMMKHLPDLIYFKDKESRFTRVSDALVEFFGADSAESVVGKTDHDFLPEQFADANKAEELALMRFNKPLIGKEEYEHAEDGKVICLSATKLPLHDESGAVIGLFGLSRDITPQKRANEAMKAAMEAAEAANRAKSDFLACMSHEIRTPMNSIIGMTELVLDTELSPTQQEYLSIVHEAAESLLTVINEILDFSRIETGRLEMIPVDISLRDEVGETLRSLSLRAHSKGIELAWQVDSDVPEFFQADPARLRQVLINLVGNAIKFTSEGEVVVEVQQEADLPGASRLHFVVSDTGIGISADKLNSIFDAFEQADNSTTRQFGGTGLGLAISKSIVDAMNGRIWVESEPGQGSRFHFVIELSDGEAPPDATSLLDLDLSKLPVVIVDDNATNRRILVETLESWNMSVRAASDGHAAIDRIREARESEGQLPLLISDIHMPGMDGFTLAETIRSIDELREMAIIVLTSGGRSGDAARCRQLGISAHLMKPAKQSELQQAITRVVGRYSKPAEEAGAATEELPSLQPLHILLVEDGIANQKLATALLQKWGHQTTLAENGQQAVDLWRAGSFDVILMDVQMPVMDGLEATRVIRQLERSADTAPPTPIVAMTARAMKGDREKCLAAGMDSYVSKPIRRQELHNVLQPLGSAAGGGDREEDVAKAASPKSDTGSQIDWQAVLETADGDEGLLAVVVEATLTELPQLTTALGEALDANDPLTAQRCAHTIKSIARTYAANRLHHCTETMETEARAENLAAVRSLEEEMKRLIDQFMSELRQRISG